MVSQEAAQMKRSAKAFVKAQQYIAKLAVFQGRIT